MQTNIITPEIVLPVDAVGRCGHVRHALTLGLPSLFANPPLVGSAMTIIANGPSAVEARLSEHGSIAVNGALGLFKAAGLAPAFWICADPGAIVAAFLEDAPAETIYLVPSCAHPSVFKALERHDVRLWHVADPDTIELVPEDDRAVLGGISSTLRALSLFAALGTRHFNIWGWDCCFIDGRDHAAGADAPADRVSVNVPASSTTPAAAFQSSKTWAAEVGNAVHQISVADYTVSVQGPGLLPAVLKYIGLPQVITLN